MLFSKSGRFIAMVLSALLSVLSLAACKSGETDIGRNPFSTGTTTSGGGGSSGGTSALVFAGAQTVNGATNKTLNVNWTHVAGAAYYTVYTVSGGVQTFNQVVTAPTATALVSSLTPSTSYTFRVRVTDTLGLSDANTTDVTQSTSANTSPTLAAIASGNAAQGVPYSLDSNEQTTGNDTDTDGDAITYSCYYDTTVDGSVASATPCTGLSNEGGGSATLNTATGAFAWTPQFAIPISTQYEFRFTGTDPYAGSGSRIFVLTIVSGTPVLDHSPAGNEVFPSTYIDQGSPLSIDWVNTLTSSDTSVTYACYFDLLVDGAVAAALACTSLPGAAAFNTTTGVLDWTPDSSTFGAYEIRVRGTTPGGFDDDIVVVDVRAPYLATNLLTYWDAGFASSSGGSGINSPLTTNWEDLVTAGASNDGTLNNFAGTTASGWGGDGTTVISSGATGPYRLILDGTDDFANLGTAANSSSSLTLEAWARPAAASTARQVIVSNGDSSDRGLTIRQSRTLAGTVEAHLGSGSYVDEVLADSPVSYFRLSETSGTTASDIMGIANGTYAGGYTLGATHGGTWGDSNLALTLGGATGRVDFSNVLAHQFTSGTLEAWIKTSAAGGSYRGIVSKQSAYGMYLNDNVLVVYDWSTGTTITRGIALNDSNWHHVVFTFQSGVPSGSGLYIDGALSGATFTYTISNQAIAFAIGAGTSPGTIQNFAGDIDEVAIYGTALSAGRIAAHYSARTKTACHSTSTLSDGNWYLLSSAFDAATTTLKLYINGSQECSITNASASLSGSANPLAAGAAVTAPNSATAGTYFNGAIGEIRTYSVGHTAGNATTNYNATKGRFGL